MSDVAAPAAQEWRRTAPIGMIARVLHSLPSAALSIVAALVGVRSIGNPWVVAGLLAVALLVTGICTVLAWRHHRYLVGPDDLRIEKGLLSRQVRAIPYDRIHDVALREPLAARLFGLVEVGFDTGTGEDEEGRLVFVTAAEGARLRDTVRARRGGMPAVEASAPPAEAVIAGTGSRLLYRLTPARLLLLGVFEFSLVVFAVLAGAAQQFDFLFDLYDWRSWVSIGGEPLRWLLGLGLAVQVVAALLGLLLLVPLGLATGIVRTALREWDFRLEQTPRGLRRQRGLLTRSDVVMPLERVQALVTATGIVRHRWGWHKLQAISLAQDSKEEKSHTLVPFAQTPEIAPIAELIGLPLPGETAEWRRASTRWRDHRAVLAAALPAATGMALVGLAPLLARDPATWLTMLLPAAALWLLAGVLVFRQWYLWRHNHHALQQALLWSREGWLSPRLAIATPIKLQSAELRQGPLARMGGYADLHLGLAGGTLALHGLPVADARDMRDIIVSQMAAVDFSAANLPA
ncbi:PH domain-containing protein [Croceibacterium sp. TMG7-5b_MA50]|uniref:PH domain-containing protein n=1 Tax=Croceibacterium sp. TMG7-5b_MA50 TaxID=3121290 RepID=UPI003221DBEE